MVNAAAPASVTFSLPVALAPVLERVHRWETLSPGVTRPNSKEEGMKASTGAAGLATTEVAPANTAVATTSATVPAAATRYPLVRACRAWCAVPCRPPDGRATVFSTC
jgi:hypothetical protein